MSKQIKISDVLHLAADKYLAKDRSECFIKALSHYSCCAIENALYELLETGLDMDSLIEAEDHYHCISKGLENMGLLTWSVRQFEEFEIGKDITPESQGARYAWLKFAAMIAESQGV